MKTETRRICHECGSDMKLSMINKVFHLEGKKVVINNIQAYQCPKCGECVYTAEETKRIENLIQEQLSKVV